MPYSKRSRTTFTRPLYSEPSALIRITHSFSVSARRFLITNSQKFRTRLFLPICKSCASLSVACQRSTLALSVGRRAFDRRFKRGTTSTRRGTMRHKSSGPRNRSWPLLTINVVCSVFFVDFLPLLTFHEANLSLEVGHLQEQLEEERARRGQTSEEIIHEATQRLAKLQHSVGTCVAIRSGNCSISDSGLTPRPWNTMTRS